MKLESEPGKSQQREIGGRRWILLGIFVIGILVRVLHFWAISGTAIPQQALTAVDSDPYAFYHWATTILAGDWLGRDTYHPYFKWMRDMAPLDTWYRWWGGKEIFHQAPLYPYLLAGLLALCRGSLPMVLLTQLLIGALQPLIIYQLGTLLFGVRVGLVAAGMTALYGPFVFYHSVLLRDWLPPMLEPLALVLLLRARRNARPMAWVVAGVVLGLDLLAKETALLLILPGLVWVLFDTVANRINAGKAASYVLAGLLLALSPLMIRNAAVGAPLLALSNRGAEAFAFGIAGRSSPNRFLPQILEHSQGRFLPGAMDAIKIYGGDWRKLVAAGLGKIILMKDSFEVPNNVSFDYAMEFSPVLRWSLGYGFVFDLGLAGWFLFLRNWRRWSLLYLYSFAAAGALLVTSPISRYRLALVPVLILFAGGVLTRFMTALGERQFRQTIGIAGLVLGCFLFQRFFLPIAEKEKTPYPVSYYASAAAYAEQKKFDLAAAEMAHLIDKLKERPMSKEVLTEASVLEGDYRTQWARELLREGKMKEAMQQAKLAEAAYARNQSLSLPYYNLGVLYAYLGDLAKGKRFLKEFLNKDPDHPLAHHAQSLLARLGS